MSLVVVVTSGVFDIPLRSALEDLGYELLLVHSPTQALQQIDNRVAFAILSDDVSWSVDLAGTQHRVPVILFAQDKQPRSVLLKLLRGGVADIFEGDLAPERLQDRLKRADRRFGHLDERTAEEYRQHLLELERDQRAGRYVQLGMLPPNPMGIDGFLLQHRMVPSLILSGDFVDYFRIADDHFVFYAADVSGHGASSAFVTVLLKNFSRRLRREFHPDMLSHPAEILTWINRELLEQRIDKHVALFLGVGSLNSEVIRHVNAGHFPPPVLVSGGSARRIEQKGKPLGLFPQVDYSEAELVLTPGDRLLIFSDGVLDVLPGDTLAEKENALMQASAAHESLEELWNALGIRPDAPGPDDMTCLSLQREA